MRQTKNPLYQEDPKISKGHTPPDSTTKFLFRGPFHSQHTKTTHIPTMANHEPEFGEHSRDQQQTRNDRQKYPFTYDEDEEEFKINYEHLEKCCNDKHF